MRSGPLSSPRYFPKRTSTQRFDEAPKLDGGLGSGTVAVIAIPLAFRRAARSSRLEPPSRRHREPSQRARHRLLTAAPVSLERLHLCCKGSCEFVESSLRTVLLRKPHHRPIFCWEKIGIGPPAVFEIFLESETRISAGMGKIDANNWFYSMTWVGRGPPSISAAGGGQLCLLFVCC